MPTSQCRRQCWLPLCRSSALSTAFLASLITVHLLYGSDASRKQYSNRYAGPYRAKFEDVYQCNHSEPTFIEAFVSCKNESRSRTVNGQYGECGQVLGNATIRQDLLSNTPPIPATLILNQWRDREWKRDGIIMKFPYALKAFYDHLPTICKPIFGDTYRVRKGFYEVDVTLNFTVKSIPVFPYGRWKGQIHVFQEKTDTPPIFCLGFLLDIIPK